MKNHSWAPNAYNCARQRWDAKYPEDPDPWDKDQMALPSFSVWGDQFTALITLSGISEVKLARFGPESEEDRRYDEQGGGMW